MAKFDNDAAIQVAEEAFRAGFNAALDVFGEGVRYSRLEETEKAWSEFEPSEAIKELIDG